MPTTKDDYTRKEGKNRNARLLIYIIIILLLTLSSCGVYKEYNEECSVEPDAIVEPEKSEDEEKSETNVKSEEEEKSEINKEEVSEVPEIPVINYVKPAVKPVVKPIVVNPEYIENSKPQISGFNVIINIKDIDQLNNQSFKLSATDKEDGDITAKIQTSAVFGNLGVGKHQVVFTVTDSDGKSTSITLWVFVADENSVIGDGIMLNASDVVTTKKLTDDNVINLYQELANPSAYNTTNGNDLTIDYQIVNKVTYVSPDGKSKYTSYELKLTVTDGETTIEKVVTISSSENMNQQKPNIYGQDVTITTGSNYGQSMHSIVAYDLQDGKLAADKIKIDSSAVNSKVSGIYPVYVTATDSDGNKVTSTFKVIVNEPGATIANKTDVYIHTVAFKVSLDDLKANTKTPTDTFNYVQSTGKVWAQNQSTFEKIVAPNLTIDTAAVQKINAAGVYFIKVTATNAGITENSTVKIVVSDGNTIIKDNVLLHAENFIVDLADLQKNQGSTNALIKFISNKDNGDIWSVNTVNGQSITPTFNPAQLAALSKVTTPGVNPLEVTSTLNGITVKETIYISITDTNTVAAKTENGGLLLHAETIRTTIELLQYAKEDGLRDFVLENANIFAQYTENGGTVNADLITFDLTRLEATTGAAIVPLTIQVSDPSITDDSGNPLVVQKVIQVYVVDGNTADNGDSYLHAKDFTTNLDTLATLTTPEDYYDFVTTNAAVVAADKATGDPVAPILIDTSKLEAATKPGVYEVTVSTADNVRVINVNVLGGSDILDKDKPYIYGENIVIQVNEKLTSEKLFAFAVDEEDGDLTSKIVYNPTLSAFNSSKAGVFAVAMTVKDSDGLTATKTVYVTVKDANSVVEDDVILYGKNFATTLTDINNVRGTLVDPALNDALVSFVSTTLNGNVWAKSTVDGTTVVPSVNVDNLKPITEAGVYAVPISATVGTSVAQKTIYVTVSDDDSIINADKTIMLKAQDFTVSLEDLKTEQAKGVASLESWLETQTNAKAWLMSDGTVLTSDEITVVTSNVMTVNKANVYNVTITATKNGSTVTHTVQMTVTDGSTNVNGNAIVHAVDFSMNLDDLATIKANANPTQAVDTFIAKPENADVWAKNKATGAAVTYTIDEGALLSVTKPQTITASVSATVDGNTATQTFKIVVLASGAVLDNEKPYLYGENITVAVNTPITANLFNLYAYDKVDGDLTADITFDKALATFDTTTAGVYPLVLSVTDSEGNANSKTVYITVTDENTVVNNQVILNAKNFETTLADLEANKATINDLTQFVSAKANGDVWAKDTTTGTNVVPELTLTQLNAATQAGVYPVAIKATAGTSVAQKTIYVTVTDEHSVIDNGILLRAEDFTVTLSNLKTEIAKGDASLERWLETQTKAKAQLVADGTALTTSEITVTITNVKPISKAGVYDVVITATKNGKSVTQTIQMTVTDSNTVIDGDVILHGSNFETNLNELAILNAQTDPSAALNDFITVNGDVWASDKLTGEDLVVTIDNSQLAAVTEPKTVTVTLTATNGVDTATKTIEVAVLADGETLDPKNPYLYGESITVPANTPITSDLFNLYAYDKQDGDLTSAITFDKPLNTFDTTKAGVFPLILRVTDSNGNSTSKTVYVTVTDDNTVINKNVILHAQSFETTLTELNANKTTIGHLALFVNKAANGDVWAKDTATGTTVPTELSLTQLNAATEAGVYPVDVKATSGTTIAQKTIYVTVTDENSVIDNGILLRAEDFTVTLPDLQTEIAKGDVSLENWLEAQTKAKAQLILNGTALTSAEIIVTITNVKPITKAGVYDVIITATKDGKSATQTIQMTVTDSNTIIDGDVILHGSDFETNLNELAILNAQTDPSAALNDFITVNGDVWASDKLTGEDLVVTIDNSQLAAVTEPKTVIVTLTATNGVDTATKTIEVAVLADGETLDPKNPYLYGENITVPANTPITSDLFNLYAYDKQDGDLTSAITFDKPLNTFDTTTAGVFPLILTVEDSNGNSTSKTVYVTVTNDDTVINKNVILHAKSFETTLTELNDNKTTIGHLALFVNKAANGDVWAKDTLTGAAVPTELSLSQLNSATQAGVYPVDVKATSGTTVAQKTIYVTVTDENSVIDNGIILSAEDFTIALNDLKAEIAKGDVSLENWLEAQTKAKAQLIADATALTSAEIVVTITNVKPITKAGVYDVIITATKGGKSATQTIQMTVTDSNTVTDGDVILHGSNFETNLNELVIIYAQADPNAALNEFITVNGDVWAKDTLTGDNITVTIDNTQLTAVTKPSTATVTLTATNGVDTATKTIEVAVLADGETLNPTNPYLYGENITVDVNSPITADLFNLYAYDKQDGDLTADITFDKVLNTFDTSTAGVYPLVLSVEDNDGHSVSKTVYVTVTDGNTVVNKNVILHAKNFETTLTELNDNKTTIGHLSLFVNKATNGDVWAKDKLTGTTVPTELSLSQLNAATQAGVYPVDVKATSGTTVAQKTIYVTVTDDNSAIDNGIILRAEDFTVALTDLTAEITKGDVSLENWLETQTKAKAQLMADGSILTSDEVVVAIANVKSITTAGVYNVVITATKDGKTVTQTIQMAVTDSDTVTDGDVILHGSNFETNLNELADINAQTDPSAALNTLITNEGNVWAKDKLTGENITVTIDNSQLAAVTEPKTVLVTLTATNGTDIATKTIEVAVLAAGDNLDPTKPYLYGENITVAVNAPVTADLFNLYAYDKQDGDLTADITFDKALNTFDTTIAGVYPLILSVEDKEGHSETKTVYVTVTGDNTVINDQIILNAKNFETTLTDLEDNRTTVAHLALFVNQAANGDVWAKDTTTGTIIGTELTLTQLNAATQSGVYPVDVKATSGTRIAQKTIYVTVTDENSSVDNGILLRAEDFTVAVEDLTAEIAKGDASFESWLEAQSKAKAQLSLDGSALTTDEITVIINDVKLVTTSGVYNVKINATKDGKSVTHTIQMTVTDEHTAENGNLIIHGENFSMNMNQLANLKAQADPNNAAKSYITENGSVWAQNKATGAGIHPIAVTEDNLLAVTKPQTVTVTISVVDGEESVNKTIDIAVLANDDVLEDTKPYIYGQSATINFGETVTPTLINAYAYDKKDGDLTDSITYSVPLADFSTKAAGVYPVTLNVADKDGNANTKTIYITVKDANTVVKDNVMLYGKNFEVTYADFDANRATTADLINYVALAANGNVWAKNTETGAPIEPTIDVAALTPVTKGGVYEIPISATAGTTTAAKSIYVTIVDTNSKVENGMFIRAENFTVTLSDLESKIVAGNTTLNTWLKTNGKTTAQLTNNAAVIPTTMVQTNVTVINKVTKAGIYEVIYTATYNGKTVSKSVQMTVTDKDTVITDNIMLHGSNFSMNMTDLAGLTTGALANTYITTNGDVWAKNTTTGATIAPVNIGNESLLAVTKPQTVQVSLSATSGGSTATKTIDIAVLGNDDKLDATKPYIYGENKTVVSGTQITSELLSAYAYDKQDGTITSRITYAPSINPADTPSFDSTTPGVRPIVMSITDTNGNSNSKTVYVTVTNDDTAVANNLIIHGKNITVTEAEVRAAVAGSTGTALTNKLVAFVSDSTKSDIWAQNMTNGLNVAPTVDVSAIQATTISGVYAVPISATDAGKTVNDVVYVTILNQNSNAENDIFIRALDFTIPIEDLTTELNKGNDAGLATWLKLKTTSTAALTQTGAALDTSAISVNAASITDVKNVTGPGIYDVTLTATSGGKSVSHTIQMAVTDSNTVVVPATMLHAQNFSMNMDTLDALRATANPGTSLDDYITEHGDVWAKNIIKNTPITNIEIDETPLMSVDHPQVVKITITAEEDGAMATRIIDVAVLAGAALIDDINPYISAQNVAVNTGTSIDIIKEQMEIFAYDKKDGDLTNKVTIAPDLTTINLNLPSINTLTLTVKDNDGNEAQVNVVLTVADNNTVVEGGVALYGRNFETNITDLAAAQGTLTGVELENALIDFVALEENAWVRAYETDNANVIIPTIDVESLKTVTQAGVYAVPISATDGTDIAAKTVYVTVMDENSVYHNGILLRTNNFTVPLAEIQVEQAKDEITYRQWAVEKSNTLAQLASDGTTLTIDEFGLFRQGFVNITEAGVYDVDVVATKVIDGVPQSVNKMIRVTVTDNDTAITNNVVLHGADFSMNMNTLNTIKNDEALTPTVAAKNYITENGVVWAANSDTGASVTVTIDTAALLAVTQPQVVNIKLTATEGTTTVEKTIAVAVLGNGDVLNPTNPYVYAENAKVTVNTTLTPELIKAFAYDKKDGVITSDIVYNPTLATFDTSTAGVKPLALSITDSEGNSSAKTVYITVTDDISVVTGNVFLRAPAIYVELSEIQAQVAKTQAELKTYLIGKSPVVAQNTTNGANITPALDTSGLTVATVTKPGIYSVPVSATAGVTAQTVMKVVVTTDGETVPADKPYIYGNDIVIKPKEPYTNALHEAFAYDKKDGDLSTSIEYTGTVDTSKTGIYPVTMTVTNSEGKSSTIIRKVYVMDRNTVINENVAVHAEDIILTVDEWAAVKAGKTADELRDYLKVTSKTWSRLIEEMIPVPSGETVSDYEHLMAVENPGYYQYTVSATDSGVTATRYPLVVIVPNGTTIDEEIPYVYSTNLTIDYDETDSNYPKNDSAAMIALHNAWAYDKEDGILEISNVSSNVNSAIGDNYITSFTVKDSDNNNGIGESKVNIKMPPIDLFDYQISSPSLSLDVGIKLTPQYVATSGYTYKVIVKKDNVNGQVVATSAAINKSVDQQVVNIAGSSLASETTYHVGLYEISTGREYPIEELTFTSPKVVGNVGYLKTIEDLESIGYMNNQQDGYVQFSDNDLTKMKYGRVRRSLNSSYALDNDIDASSTLLNTAPDTEGGFGTDGFKPIGEKFTEDFSGVVISNTRDGYANYKGTLDGKGYTISNLTLINDEAFAANMNNSPLNPQLSNFSFSKRLGIVSQLSTTATIKNLNLDNANVTMQGAFGGLFVGVNEGVIDNVRITNSKLDAPKGTHVGGMVGLNVNTVTNSSFTGEVNGLDNGALTRVNSVQTAAVGGIAAMQDYQKGLIRNVVFDGIVRGSNNVGGIVGWNGGANTTTTGARVENSASYGTLFHTGDNIGGIYGGGSNQRTTNNVIAGMDIEKTKLNLGTLSSQEVSIVTGHGYVSSNVLALGNIMEDDGVAGRVNHARVMNGTTPLTEEFVVTAPITMAAGTAGINYATSSLTSGDNKWYHEDITVTSGSIVKNGQAATSAQFADPEWWPTALGSNSADEYKSYFDYSYVNQGCYPLLKVRDSNELVSYQRYVSLPGQTCAFTGVVQPGTTSATRKATAPTVTPTIISETSSEIENQQQSENKSEETQSTQASETTISVEQLESGVTPVDSESLEQQVQTSEQIENQQSEIPEDELNDTTEQVENSDISEVSMVRTIITFFKDMYLVPLKSIF